jgi:hypothetical protein
MKTLLSAVALLLAVLPFSASRAAALTFSDWTSVDTSAEVAEGTLGPVSVTLTGGNLVAGVIDGTFTGFNAAFFTPPLVTSDMVEPLGPNPSSTLSYTVIFSSPLTNPRMHLRSLASVLTFSGVTLTKLSGETTFVVAGDTVTGAFDDTTSPGHDANGTIQLNGTFSSFVFTAQAVGVFTGGGDGFDLQIGAAAEAVPEPAPLVLLIAGLAAMGYLAPRRHRSRGMT